MKFKDGRGWGGGSETTAITKKVKYRVSREVPVAVVAREDVQSVVGRRRRQREHQTCAEEKERDSRQLERERAHEADARRRHDVHPVHMTTHRELSLNDGERHSLTPYVPDYGAHAMRKRFCLYNFYSIFERYCCKLLYGQKQVTIAKYQQSIND